MASHAITQTRAMTDSAPPQLPTQAPAALRDSLQQTLSKPDDFRVWHALRDAYYAAEAANFRAEVVASLLASVPDHGVAAFLRATFLSAATGERHWSTLAGQIALTLEPASADRLMAFCVVEWGHTVMHGLDRSAFIVALHASGIPPLMAQMGRMLSALAPPLSARAIPWLHRVAVLCPYLGSEAHPPSSMALHQVTLLQNMGLQVRLFSCQETRVTQAEQYFGSKATLLTPPATPERLQQLASMGVDVQLADDSLPLMVRWQSMLANIAAYDPDLILFVGLNSPLLAPLYATRPVLGLCVHATPPMAAVDVWLTSTPALAQCHSAPWVPDFPPALGHYHPFRVKLKPATHARTREEFDLQPGQIALISAGFRLESEINGEWAARMLALLQHHPQVVWMLVGGNGGLPAALAAAPQQQLRLVKHQPDLRSLMRCADMYVNPARIGGGFSVAEAMAEGLPTLALADSDGGDKLGPFAAEHMDGYFAQLDALLADGKLRAQRGAQLRQRFQDVLDIERSGPSLLMACELARQRFVARSKSLTTDS